MTMTDPSHSHPSTSAASRGRNAEPVFVVGMNGSGTTMLLDSLGRHRALYAFPQETRLIPHLYARRAQFGDLQDDGSFLRLWDEVRRLMVFRHANGGVEVPLPEDWADYPRDLSAVLDGVFRHFAARQQKSRWCEKSPQHAQHLQALAALFPRARFVHIIRDGRDCAASFHRRWKRTPELTMHRWKRVVREARRQGAAVGHDRYLELTYEAFTSEPELWLRRVCAFLGLEFDAAVLQSAQPWTETASEGAAGPTGFLANSGKWRHYFSAGRLARLERIGGSTLQALGYETGHPEADRDLGNLERRLYAVKDVLYQYAREIALKLGGRIERPWTLILSKPMTAWRHRRVNRY